MYGTFNMGTGFVAAVPPGAAETLAGETGGRRIGTVAASESEEGVVAVAGLELG
jgi:phosphoribosylformylglycinamidine cyclo-ligase